MNLTGIGIADMNENTMRNDLIMRTKINPPAVNSKGNITLQPLILERCRDSFKLFAYFDVLRANGLTLPTFDTLTCFFVAMHNNVKVFTIFRQWVIPVKCVHVQGIE